VAPTNNGYGEMKDKHLERIKSIKRASRIEMGGIGGRAGTHVDKSERRIQHMGTRDWIEEAEEDIAISEEIEKVANESHKTDTEEDEEG